MLAASLVAAWPHGGAVPAGAQTRPPEQCDYEVGTDIEAGGADDEGIRSRRRLKILPFRLVNHPCSRPAGFRAVHVTPTRLELVGGGTLIERVPLRAAAGTPVPFERIAEILISRSWAAEVEPGVFELSAALVQAPGTTLIMTAPRVKEVRLLNEPGVFLGGRGAAAHLEGVSIVSWDKDAGGPDLTLDDGRPFVYYHDGSRLNILRSQLSWLGSDRTSGYGVTWGRDTTGEVDQSAFAHNFFGVYTNQARDLVIRRSVIHSSVHYGLDPHTATRALVVEDNELYGNGSHGLIGSDDVTDSAFRRNRSHHNVGNGIVMHRRSDRNVIEENQVADNGRDGIVINGSTANLVARNVVRNHRVGIRVNEAGTGNRVVDNVVEATQAGIQAYGGASEVELTGNTITGANRTGIMLAAPGSVVRGGTIRGAAVGISVRTATQVTGTAVSQVDNAVVVVGGASARLDRVKLTARLQPVKTHTAGAVTVHGSSLRSLTSSGDERAWLPLVGAAAIALAVALEVFRRRRDRREPVLAPPGVWNTS